MKHQVSSLISLILILVEQKVLFCRIIWPYIFNALIYIAFILNLLQVFYNLKRSTRTLCVINQFLPCCWPRGIFQLRSQFQSPIHSLIGFLKFFTKIRAKIAQLLRNTRIFLFFYLSLPTLIHFIYTKDEKSKTIGTCSTS